MKILDRNIKESNRKFAHRNIKNNKYRRKMKKYFSLLKN